MDILVLEKRLTEIVARLGLLRLQREGELKQLRAAQDNRSKITALKSLLRKSALEIARLKRERLVVASQLAQVRPQRKERYTPPRRRKTKQ